MQWKSMCFKELICEHNKGRALSNVFSIGDSLSERNALFTVVKYGVN